MFSTVQNMFVVKKLYNYPENTYIFKQVPIDCFVLAYYSQMTYDRVPSKFLLPTDIANRVLTAELYGVYCEDLGYIWPHFNSTTLYSSGIPLFHHIEIAGLLFVYCGNITNRTVTLSIILFNWWLFEYRWQREL